MWNLFGVFVSWFQYLGQQIKYARCDQNRQLSGIPMALGALLMIRIGSKNNGLSVEDSLRYDIWPSFRQNLGYLLWFTAYLQTWLIIPMVVCLSILRRSLSRLVNFQRSWRLLCRDVLLEMLSLLSSDCFQIQNLSLVNS